MFVSKRAFQAAQDQIVQLRLELAAVQSALARQVERERDVADAMIAARADARDVRVAAEQEAHDLLAQARKEADALRAASQADVAATRAEVARLQQVQRELTASFDQKVAALRSALAPTPGIQVVGTDDREDTPGPVSTLPAPAPAPAPRFAGAPSDAVAELFRDFRAETSGTAVPTPRPAVRPSGRTDRTGALAFSRALLRPVPAATAVAVLALGAWAWWSLAGGGSPSTAPTRTGLPVASEPRPASSSETTKESPDRAGNVLAANAPRPAVGVQLRAVRDVWLRVEVDGKSTTNRLVRAGEQFSVAAGRGVVLRAGDAGALLISVDGRPPVALGRDGAVVTKRISAAVQPTGRSTVATAPLPARPSPAVQTAVDPKPALAKSPPASESPTVVPTPPVAAAEVSVPSAAAATQPPAPAPAAEPPKAESATAAPSVPEPTDAGLVAGDDQHAVLRGHEQYFQALGRGGQRDVVRIAGNSFTTVGTPVLDASGRPFPISIASAQVEVRGVGAVVSGTASQRIGGPGDQARDEPLLFSEVWVKRGNQWQLVNVRFLSPGAKR